MVNECGHSWELFSVWEFFYQSLDDIAATDLSSNFLNYGTHKSRGVLYIILPSISSGSTINTAWEDKMTKSVRNYKRCVHKV